MLYKQIGYFFPLIYIMFYIQRRNKGQNGTSINFKKLFSMPQYNLHADVMYVLKIDILKCSVFFLLLIFIFFYFITFFNLFSYLKLHFSTCIFFLCDIKRVYMSFLYTHSHYMIQIWWVGNEKSYTHRFSFIMYCLNLKWKMIYFYDNRCCF